MNFTEIANKEFSTPSLFTLFSYFIFSFLTLLCLVLNIKVIYVVVVSLAKRHKGKVLVSLLAAQLSLVSIGLMAVSTLNVSDRVGFIKQRGQIMCSLMGFLRTTLPCVICTNMTAIIYERFRTFNEDQGEIIVSRLFALIWLFPIIQGIPSSLMSTYIRDDAKNYGSTKLTGDCLPVPFFANDYITIINEVIRFSIFHLGASGYMAYVYLKTRSQLHSDRSFTLHLNRRIQKKLQNLRFILLHFLFFVLFLIPMGILFLVRRTLKRVIVFGDNASGILPDTLLNKCSGLLLLSYLSVNPCVNLYLLDGNFSIFPQWCRRLSLTCTTDNPNAEERACELAEIERRSLSESKVEENQTEGVEGDSRTSVVSTCNVSSLEKGCMDEHLAGKERVVLGESEISCCAAKTDDGEVKVVLHECVMRETLI